MNQDTLTPNQLIELRRAVSTMVNSEMITNEEALVFLGRAGLIQVDETNWTDTTGTKYAFK